MWLLPTRQRPESLKRFFAAYAATKASTPGLVLVNTPEFEATREVYDAIALPKGWHYLACPANSICEANCYAWQTNRDLREGEWIGLMCDDFIPETEEWDKKMIGSLNGCNIISANDGWQAPQRMTAAVWSGDVARAIGGISLPGFKHMYMDDVWEVLGRETQSWFVMMDVMVRHHHAMLTGQSDATTEYVNSFMARDRARFERWAKDEKAAQIEAIRTVQKQHGYFPLVPNVNGLKLMIATPSASGEYEDQFVSSLLRTFDLLRQLNVPHYWVREMYNADIANARAKLFSIFVRSPDFTHMLLLDDDMGWDNNAVLRLIAAKKDLVSVAGPKKTYPIKFACNRADEDGNAIAIIAEPETGAGVVDHVGMAFALISRRAADLMVAAHPDLAFEGENKETIYAVYNPMVRNRRYFAEDFAFCERWRALGEQVFVCPDVPLTHTGKHTFTGKLTDTASEPKTPLVKVA